jgi:hypothetical protein
MHRDGEKLIFNEKNAQDVSALGAVKDGFDIHPEFKPEEMQLLERLIERKRLGGDPNGFTVDVDEARIMIDVLEHKIGVDTVMASFPGSHSALQNIAASSHALPGLRDFVETVDSSSTH